MCDRKKCTYPMSKFYIYEDEVPADTRVSTPEDCEECDVDYNCEDAKHCLIVDVEPLPIPHPNPDE